MARSRVLERIFDRFLRRCCPDFLRHFGAICAIVAVASYSINTQRCNRGPSMPQIDTDTFVIHGNSFCHGKPAYSADAWPADGRPLQTPPPASSRPFSDLTATMLLYRCSLCPLPHFSQVRPIPRV